jgi:hypothetical protein
LFALVQHAFQVELSTLTIKPYQIPGVTAEGPDGLVLPISESKLNDSIRQALTVDGVQAQGIELVDKSQWGRIYTGRMPGSGKRVFARVVARKIPCGDCHDVFYVYGFDAGGNFLTFIPISVFKYGNRPWSEKDIGKIRDRFTGKSLTSKFTFNADVDAVSSATISTRLIYDSIGNTEAVVEELVKKGYAAGNR